MQLAYQWWKNISREASNQPPRYTAKTQQPPVQLSALHSGCTDCTWLSGQVNVKAWIMNEKNNSDNQAFPNRAYTVSVVSTNRLYFWLQLSGYRKRFEGASLLCCGLEQSCAYLVSPGAGKKKSSWQNHKCYHEKRSFQPWSAKHILKYLLSVSYLTLFHSAFSPKYPNPEYKYWYNC